ADMLENGTALDVGLGIAPASGKTARHGVLLEKRDRLIRHVRQAIPEWHDLSDRQAAAAIIKGFSRYRATRWTAQEKAGTASPYEPDGSFWRLSKLALPDAKQMPGLTTVTNILRGVGGG
ncbi:hypothetical protein G5B31_20750, partial [Rhodobacter sp. SGA-6-6]|uniref:hypothetical protein n=1 Tax=Rhodobacter sp. SGA-6-6 TaxID=2710882 RepID=UPI0013EE0B1E